MSRPLFVNGTIPFGLIARRRMDVGNARCAEASALRRGQQLAAAFRFGILFLLAAPFVAFGVVATLAIRSRRPRHIATGGNRRDN